MSGVTTVVPSLNKNGSIFLMCVVCYKANEFSLVTFLGLPLHDCCKFLISNSSELLPRLKKNHFQRGSKGELKIVKVDPKVDLRILGSIAFQ